MTEQHTAGLWTASTAPSTSGRGYDISRDGVRIASTPGWHPDDARAANEAANAHLIAASPDLADILAQIVFWNDAQDPHRLETSIQRAADLLRSIGIDSLQDADA
jgi:hypothetical protein